MIENKYKNTAMHPLLAVSKELLTFGISIMDLISKTFGVYTLVSNCWKRIRLSRKKNSLSPEKKTENSENNLSSSETETHEVCHRMLINQKLLNRLKKRKEQKLNRKKHIQRKKKLKWKYKKYEEKKPQRMKVIKEKVIQKREKNCK